MKLIVTLSGIILVLVMTACGVTGDPVPAPGRDPVPPLEGSGPDAEVPEASITNEAGEAQVGRPGTRCWDGMCVDMAGISAPAEPLTVSSEETLILRVSAGQPTDMNLRVLEWRESDFAGQPGETIIDFEAPVVASGDLDLMQEVEWVPALAPGEYALNLFSSYGTGDISYGWHILVEE